MNMYIALPFLVSVVGLIVWAVASSRKPNPPAPNEYVVESGRIAFSYGLLVTLFACMTRAFTSLSPAVTSSISFVVCVVGFLIWLFAGHAVLKAAGKIAFKWGLFVSVLGVMTHMVKF